MLGDPELVSSPSALTSDNDCPQQPPVRWSREDVGADVERRAGAEPSAGQRQLSWLFGCICLSSGS